VASDDESTAVGGPEVAASGLPSLDALLDAALADSFPASDPPALVLPHGGRRPVGGAGGAPDEAKEQARDR
jgi:hypothetical protein